MVSKNQMEGNLIGDTSNFLSGVYTLSNSLECFLFLSYTYFCRVVFNQVQQNIVLGLITFLISELENFYC